MRNEFVIATLFLMMAFVPIRLLAHCDTMDGPVVLTVILLFFGAINLTTKTQRHKDLDRCWP